MNFLRVCSQLLLVFVVALFFVSGLKGEAWLLEEQDEEMLVIQVFGFTNETENESIPIEGASVNVNPTTIEFREPGLSYRERKEAEAAFHQRRVTDENGVVAFNLSRTLYYFNTTCYFISADAVGYIRYTATVDVTNTKNITVFLKKFSETMRRVIGGIGGSTNSLFSNPLFLLIPLTTVATSTTILALILKRKHARKKQL